jgi:hypothetical protein
MCLIIVSSKPGSISKAVATSALRKNPDGVGVMWYTATGELRVRRWLKATIKKWWPEFRAIVAEAEAAGSELAVHWRMATHGEVTLDMCHPFSVATPEGEALMMHNGIISGYGEKSYTLITGTAAKTKSDTWEYARVVESIVADGSAKLLSNPAFLELLGNDVGASNKLVFGLPRNAEKKFFVVNQSSGLYHEGHWFSNLYAWDSHSVKGTKKASKSSNSSGNSYLLRGWSDWYESSGEEPTLGETREYQEILERASSDITELETLLCNIESPGPKVRRLQAMLASGTLEEWEIVENTQLIVDEYAYENGF